MAIYQNQSGCLSNFRLRPFKLEKDIQKLFEANLPLIMGLDVVKSEFSIKNKRIDTLAFDPQSKAFIIIEYKRDRNISVVDQGFTYLSLMLENRADFLVEYNESLKRNMKREDVDWTQTRVIFVSTDFTENQKQATNFKDIAIELWEVKQYENGIISIDSIKKSMSAESIKPLTQQNPTLKRVTDEIKVYTEQDHISIASEYIAELYATFRNAIINLSDNIEVKPLKKYIAFKKDSNISDIEIQKKSLKIYINLKSGLLDDPKKIAVNISNIGHWGNGDFRIQVSDDKDLEYILSLIKQAIK